MYMSIEHVAVIPGRNINRCARRAASPPSSHLRACSRQDRFGRARTDLGQRRITVTGSPLICMQALGPSAREPGEVVE